MKRTQTKGSKKNYYKGMILQAFNETKITPKVNGLGKIAIPPEVFNYIATKFPKEIKNSTIRWHFNLQFNEFAKKLSGVI